MATRGRKKKDELDVSLKVVNGILAAAAVLFILMTQPLPVIQGWIEDLFLTETVPASELTYLEYDGVNQVIEVNGNKPTFDADELSLDDGSWQSFSELDRLNRVGAAHAMLGTDLFPLEEREPLYIDPTGWKQKKLDNGQWLYNRSHLIGFQLTGENNNIRNLMTGTRSLNNPHMLRFENDIDYYLEQTNNHVRYLVEPIFRDDELVARGVHMMAQSVEDEGLSFNVYIFNIQDGYEINYQDGSSRKSK
ncbi:DNA-entry nuclease [Jeotgalibaca sp. PTS2502]|nr:MULTISPECIES: DNA/RNA non-specific endonuclease [Jeotgalibaca]APZ49995.1 DNA-entry nuclease [Jeotgalibaca sp. PTS2502]